MGPNGFFVYTPIKSNGTFTVTPQAADMTFSPATATIGDGDKQVYLFNYSSNTPGDRPVYVNILSICEGNAALHLVASEIIRVQDNFDSMYPYLVEELPTTTYPSKPLSTSPPPAFPRGNLPSTSQAPSV